MQLACHPAGQHGLEAMAAKSGHSFSILRPGGAAVRGRQSHMSLVCKHAGLQRLEALLAGSSVGLLLTEVMGLAFISCHGLHSRFGNQPIVLLGFGALTTLRLNTFGALHSKVQNLTPCPPFGALCQNFLTQDTGWFFINYTFI